VTAIVRGSPRVKSLERDSEGYRDYIVAHLVETSADLDGPQIVSGATGLPAVGDEWNFGNDSDTWCKCWPDMKVNVHQEKEGDVARIWKVEQKFSNRPLNRCQDASIDNPLLEPQKVSGGFVKYTVEATKDRNGNAIMNSAHEMFRGPQVEFDANRPTVRIEQNVLNLQLSLCSSMVDTVNDSDLWNMGPRTIKLSNFTWERLLYGTCTYYFKRIFDFDVNIDTFDRKLLDEGTKVLRGHYADTTAECTAGPGTGTGTGTDAPATGNTWILDNVCGAAPDADNPQHFIRYKDRNDENARVILNGAGLPASSVVSLGTGTGTGDPDVTTTGEAGEIDLEYYPESNFLLLGIPTTFS
jgi:hypothetical protein